MAEVDCDVLVVGAGPAGLTAAVYLARYRRKVLVVHDGSSRAARIPLTHNVPGFPGGVSGAELLQRMEEQAKLYGGVIIEDQVVSAGLEEGGKFVCRGSSGTAYRATALILATGVTLNQVALEHEVHEECIVAGCLRYCPICDGYEATNRKVAVIGSNLHGAREALFLRQFTDDVVLLPRQWSDLTDAQQQQLAAAGVTVLDQPMTGLAPAGDKMGVTLADGTVDEFDVLYPALGATPRSELAAQLGLELAEEGCILTDKRQASNVPGAFAAGDVVDGLDQVSVAIGHGAIAATRAHNYLRELEGLADVPG